MISKVEILGSRLQRAETVYNFAASGMLLALWLTVLGIWSQPDPRVDHCYAALDTFENMRLGLLETPAMKLPKHRREIKVMAEQIEVNNAGVLLPVGGK